MGLSRSCPRDGDSRAGHRADAMAGSLNKLTSELPKVFIICLLSPREMEKTEGIRLRVRAPGSI